MRDILFLVLQLSLCKQQRKDFLDECQNGKFREVFLGLDIYSFKVDILQINDKILNQRLMSSTRKVVKGESPSSSCYDKDGFWILLKEEATNA